jgi:segregation and condensation protein A
MIKIKLDKFEGPLSLLLRLIEKEEMDITEVSLAAVADQYIDYIRRSGQIDPEEMADFLVVAARLLLIKSKALLPYLYPEEEEEIEELEEQLRMYKEFLEAAKKIEKMVGRRKFMFAREFNRRVLLTNNNFFSPPPNLTAGEMKNVFLDLISRLKPPEALQEETLDHKINIEDKILLIQKMLLDRLRVSFNRVLSIAKSKTEIIVSFLAVLELMRQREVILRQDNLFGEILIEKCK